ncbi:MAG: hypothetical protein IKQ35_05210 [Bacilli bacterium]|nr:hypothetical protein [Bacilli bacterium]
MKKRLNCKDANVNFINSGITLIFTMPILFLILPLINVTNDLFINLYFLILIIIDCVFMYIFAIKRIIRNIIVRRKGKIVTAIVKSYCDDNYYINGRVAQKILLKINSDDNTKKDICYKLSSPEKGYEIDSEIELYSYKDIFLIKDKKSNIRQRIIITITSFVFVILVLYTTIFTLIPLIFKVSPYQMGMNIIQKTNKEVRFKLINLRYEIPKEFNLSDYQKDRSYGFETKNDKHFCRIYINVSLANPKGLPVGKCQFYDINGHYMNYDEVQLNGVTWCYEKEIDEEEISEEYMINDGKHYFSIGLYNYKDNDETCYTGFEEFKKSIKLIKD